MRRYNKYTVPTGKVTPNKRCLSETRATRAQRKVARQRSEVATSKWRTALQDCSVVQRDGMWNVIAWDGRCLFTGPSLTDALAAAS